jgi:hypothetical protein
MPSWTHIHLMLNHVPVVGIAVPIVFLLIDRARKNRGLEWLSLQMFVVFALLTIPVYLTGSPASHYMREMPGISRDLIHRHSDAADFAFWAMEALGALSLGALYKFRESATVPQRLSSVLLLIALTTLGLMIWTANLGGKIRHPEIAQAGSHAGFSGDIFFVSRAYTTSSWLEVRRHL